MNHEWSESGINLLDRFKSMIIKNGGAHRLAITLELEWASNYKLDTYSFAHRKSFINWSNDEDNFLIKNHELSDDEISNRMLSRTSKAIMAKRYKFKRRGIIP